jgi:hypothetical protein
MSTQEKKPRRTLDQDFIDGAAKLVTQERYKNPRDRVTYLGTINHIDIPRGMFRGPSSWSSHVG